MSMAIQFDTLRYVEKLKSAGIPEAQAKAEAEALATALGESASGLLATKDDITNIKIEMADIKTELKLMKWMVVTIVAGVISLVAKAFF
jgi:hypothetical protein